MSGISISGLAGGSPVALARGGRDFRETIERSQRVKQATGSVAKWLDHLERHDIYGATVRRSFSMDKGPSTEDLAESDLDINISLVYDCNTDEHYAELNWLYDGGYGDDPLDIVGLFYDSSWWKLASTDVSATTSTSTYVKPEDNWGFDFEGPGYSMDDQNADWNGDWGDFHYAGVYLVERDDDVDPTNREIQGHYAHTWEEITFDSVSVSYPAGISASFSDEEYKEIFKEDKQGDLLRISQDDATLENCGGVQ